MATTISTASDISPAATGQINAFTGGWGNGAGLGAGSSQREFEFTAFVAKYNGGNWDVTFAVVDGVPQGALPNLHSFISNASRHKIKTNYRRVEPIPLDSDKIFATPSSNRQAKLSKRLLRSLGPGRKTNSQRPNRRHLLATDEGLLWCCKAGNKPGSSRSVPESTGSKANSIS